MVLANESPLKQEFDAFDIKNTELFYEDYKKIALTKKPERMNDLLLKDWTWRACHGQNIVASMVGTQGSGKTRPFMYAACLLGNIFGEPFVSKNIFWSLEELNDSIPNLPIRSTILKDEHKHANSGYMAKKELAHLLDLEEQLREPRQINLLFTSVYPEMHANFFAFEAKHINWDKKGTKPLGYYAMLSTPRYTERNCFVWRGMVYFPQPPEDIDADYRKRKAQTQTDMVEQRSSTLDAVQLVGAKIFKKRLDSLTVLSKSGAKKPISAALMLMIINEEIGTSRFSIKGYQELQAIIRDLIEKHYANENAELETLILKEKTELKEQARILQEKLDIEKSEERKIRFDLLKQKIEEMRLTRQLREQIRAEKKKAIDETLSQSDKNRIKLVENQEKAMQ